MPSSYFFMLLLGSTYSFVLQQGSNAELRDRLHELSAQAEAAQAQVAALEGLQSSLQESAGPSVDALVETAVDRERAVQDARNRKVLELLNNKVSCIASSGSLSYRQVIKAAGTSCCFWSCACVFSERMLSSSSLETDRLAICAADASNLVHRTHPVPWPSDMWESTASSCKMLKNCLLLAVST